MYNKRFVLNYARFRTFPHRSYSRQYTVNNTKVKLPGNYFYYGILGLFLISASNFACDRYYRNDSMLLKNSKVITPEEVARHNKRDDCWVVINDSVYNLTDFIDSHPGGKNVIVANSGKDVTKLFEPIHAPNVLEKYLQPKMRLGTLSKPMPPELVCDVYAPGETAEELNSKIKLRASLPALNEISNIYDFEYLASKILSKQAWAYYSSGSDDEISLRENHNAYHRIFFNPRVLVDVSEIDTSTTIFGKKQDVPFYASATALCKLGNPLEGEKDITRGCGQGPTKIPQMVSTLASCSPSEISSSKIDNNQSLWFQLYLNHDRNLTNLLVKEVEKLGYTAIFVTVDAPTFGKREKDAKLKFLKDQEGSAKIMKDKPSSDEEAGASRALSKFIDPSVTWNDIAELKKLTTLPIIIKGVQRKEDILKAAEIGCQGVVISNHGGRQLDFAKAPIEVLAESMDILKERKLDKTFNVFIDGGIRRGTDILKALCLGAKGIGLGRPFLYANSCYGKDGVQKTIDILKYELEMSMRLLGVTSIDELDESFLDLSSIKNRTVLVPKDTLSEMVYNPSKLIEILPKE
ncbi:hypothetical protein TPHA_0B01820 [Tetrapisispora phaffii CBS 4417]|uniref:L-lactate dehydrogenase (cytochrome) n=1 Tax=Tetrapisispora phaffii (strain ATCC 24235 / CBS 4417 / NBRC 1672 / NRRL Y-8282 / UCD 70-5) TaxID=1071381 RepID=G8BPC4_TETPH|nr:hypothetical protein TPHA_0B01820 [Tetrapisispora phaffii CBS 4417]CCE61855.1 hypothetical protein TPHA_0B01820 [Tetrapisispora phaffii CBS 4417]